jgi:hypothetical protein
LTTVGDDFEWQWCQHQPMLLPDQDNNPSTLDILLLDNGQNKSFSEESAVDATENYSRAVQYRIDPEAMTVQQIWEYGKERGVECYATYLGDANYEPLTGNRLITFGGQLSADVASDRCDSGRCVGEIITRSRVVEVTEDREVVLRSPFRRRLHLLRPKPIRQSESSFIRRIVSARCWVNARANESGRRTFAARQP